MLTCYRTRHRIGAYLDGALDEPTARRTAAHLKACTACGRQAEELRRLRSLLRRTLAPAAEPEWTGFWHGIVRGIEEGERVTPAPPARGAWGWMATPRWALGGALAAALLLSLGLWQLAPGPGSPPADGTVLVTSALTEDPRGTVMVYSTPEQDVAVVWVLGIED